MSISIFRKHGCIDIIVLIMSMCSCQYDEIQGMQEKTVVLYIVADNDLYSYAHKLLKSMEKLSPIENTNILVYIDDLNTPSLYFINNGIHLIKKYDERNSLSPNSINDVLAYVLSKFPSKENGLIMWSHGTGWIYTDAPYTRSFGIDRGETINITELSNSIPDKFDYIIFDACYMNSIELLTELQHKTKYIIGSPTIVPPDGIIDKKAIMLLVSNKALEERLIKVCDNYIYTYYQYNDDLSITLSSTNEIGPFIKYISHYGKIALNDGIIENIYIYPFRNQMVFFDALKIFKQIGLDSTYLEKVVLYHRMGLNNKTEDGGISVFIPLQANNSYHMAYSFTKWNQTTNWLDKFIENKKRPY